MTFNVNEHGPIQNNILKWKTIKHRNKYENQMMIFKHK